MLSGKDWLFTKRQSEVLKDLEMFSLSFYYDIDSTAVNVGQSL